jgi:HK97 family phage prohead protease
MNHTQVLHRETRSTPLPEKRAIEAGDVFTGYAAKYNVRSSLIAGSFFEVIAPGAFDKSLAEDDVLALVDHCSDKVLGRTSNGTLILKSDDVGLSVSVTPPNTTYASDLKELILRGDVKGMSFAFVTEKDEWVKDKVDGTVTRTLIRVRLLEVTFTANPAYMDTVVDMESYEDYVDGNDDSSLTSSDLELESMARALSLADAE